jgi:hypothetical protein
MNETLSDYQQRMREIETTARNLRARLELIEDGQFVQKTWNQKGKEAKE